MTCATRNDLKLVALCADLHRHREVIDALDAGPDTEEREAHLDVALDNWWTAADTPAHPRTQHRTSSKEVTALVVMTPHGPATCADWAHARSPAANPWNKAAVEYWSDGYLSGLAAGSGHNIIGLFRRDALVAWMDKYCGANPQTHLPLAINALGRVMVAHPGGQL
jgi:hypothetical protein